MKIIVTFLLFVLFILCYRGSAGAIIQVGGEDGWKIPTDPDTYNRSASEVKFHVGDTLDYGTCTTSNPISESVRTETHYKLRELGTLYFISGTFDHCEQGQKLIVQVLPTSAPTYPPPSPVVNFDVPIVDGPPTQGESSPSINHHKRKMVIGILIAVVLLVALVVAVIYGLVRAHGQGGFSNFGSQVEPGKWAVVA